MVTETSTVEISQKEYEDLQRIKDQLHALEASSKSRPLCDHSCAHGHKAINIDMEQRRKQMEAEAALDRADKERRLEAEDRRLDGLVRAGRIDRNQKAKIMAQERERMGL